MFEDMNKLLNTTEELHPELMAMVEPAKGPGTFAMLRHPLLYSIPYYPQMNALHNFTFKAKSETLEHYKRSKNWSGMIALYERPYRVDVLLKLRPKLQMDEYWPLLAHVWVDSESLEHYSQRQLLDLLCWKRGHRRELMMEEADKAAFRLLPSRVQVFHGYDPHGKQQRLSWSTEYRVAKFFATRYGTKGGRILHGWVEKRHAFAYLTSRNEAEMIVHPKHVKVTQDGEVVR